MSYNQQQQGGYGYPQQGGPPQQGQYGQPPPQQQQQWGQPQQQQGYGQQQYGNYGGPPQQGQYGQPPPQGQYQQQGGYYQQGPPPQQGQYNQGPPPQQGQFNQGPPPQHGQYNQGPPPQQGQYNQGPPQQGQYNQGPPPQGQQQYGGPPQGQYQQYGAPPPGQYQQGPPQGQYGQPPPQHGGYGAPQGYGQPPPQQQYVQPTPASPGYDPRQAGQPMDTSREVEAIRKAFKGMGCDEKALIVTMIQPKLRNPFAMKQLVNDYNKRFMRDLLKDIESETRGNLEDGLLALARGPLEQDVRVLRKALDRAGTDEAAVYDVLLCRSNADLKAVIAEYKRQTGHDVFADVKSDFDSNDKLVRLFSMVLKAERAEDSAPVVPYEIDQKVTELQRATEGQIGTNEVAVAQVFASCNDAQLKAVSTGYEQKFHKSLLKVIESEFSGDLEDALIRMLLNAIDKPAADAQLLRKPLNKGMRQDGLIINRLVRLYWNKPRLDAAKATYQQKYRQTLAADIKEETSGDYEKFLLALVA